MQCRDLIFVALAAMAMASPVKMARPVRMPRSFGVPTNNGFPNPQQNQLQSIFRAAGGTLSNAPPPPRLANSSLTAFQVIAAQEQFESAFFSSLIANITSFAPGYEIPSSSTREQLLGILGTVLAQEELHAINAQNILMNFNGTFVPSPCKYNFGVNTLHDAIVLAETFTSVVVSTLQDVIQLLAENGDSGPTRAVASVIGQEGEQDGFYRLLLARTPSQKPFLTTNVAPFAWSVLQTFIVPGSCNLSSVNVPIFTPLKVLSGQNGTNVAPMDQQISYSADLTGVKGASSFVGGNGTGLFLTLLTGQDLPFSVPLNATSWSGSVVTFNASFPYNDLVADGLSIAALTTSGNVSLAGLPNSTLAAPGLIQVQPAGVVLEQVFKRDE